MKRQIDRIPIMEECQNVRPDSIKNNFTIEYALRDIHKPMRVAGYETKIMESLPQYLKGSFPTVEEFEAELAKENRPPES